jgi:hypothetical protein
MKAYRDWKPSENDISGLNAPDKQDWLVAPVILTRDSQILEESNYHTLRKQLDAANSDDWAAMEFGHWACGWFKIIVVRPGSSAAQIAQDAEQKLQDYPILNEDDFSNREWEYAHERWEQTSLKERIKVCADYGVSIFAARKLSPPMDVYERWTSEA